ncbi:outer membrane beta-barrel protein, partial [Winogradskyella sp.]|uniref:outer membrane beta-barrel protein n=1 Tax=Winogradskyella sp. TaxID=1883156 RepID=UPI00262B16FB
MKTIVQLTVLLITSLAIQAQSSLSGLVVDEELQPIPAAIVSVYTTDKSTFVKAAVAEDNGKFIIKKLASGDYVLVVTSLGFEDYTSEKFTHSNTAKDFGVIKLNPASETLEEVVIEAEKPMVQVMADKTVFNVQNSINAAGDSGFELLRKAPGVIIDNNDNLIVEGKTGVLIYIDDKPSVLRGEDLVNYLKSIQSSDIEAIEIITQPSSKYDAEGNAGIINLKLKRDKSLGTNGSIASGLTYGEFARVNNSISFNNRSKKTSFYGTFSNQFGESLGFINLYRQQNNTIFDARTETIYDNVNTNARFGFDWYTNKKSTFGIILSGNFSNNDSFADSRTPIIPNGNTNPEQVLVAGSDTQSDVSNLYTNINYKYKGDNGSSFNVDVDYGRYSRERENFQPNQYFNGDESQIISETINFMVTPIDIDLFTAKVDYEQNLLKGKLSFGGKFSKVVTDNQFDFFDRINGQDILNTERTNDFEYDENINALYFNYSRQFKKWNIQFGLR